MPWQILFMASVVTGSKCSSSSRVSYRLLESLHDFRIAKTEAMLQQLGGYHLLTLEKDGPKFSQDKP